ncbi:MAG: methyltransferase, partial [Bdellovibrionota bacterium]
MGTWHLKRGSEKKFKAGHPWVFSSELAQSPKGIEAGALIELRDHSGNFLALGYGHPNSMISFRTLSLEKGVELNAEFFAYRFLKSSRARTVSGVGEQSHRFIFAEGDYLPGLIIDRFFLESSGQVFVVQTSTAGMTNLLPTILLGIESFNQKENRIAWDKTAIVVANDSKSRLMEGMTAEPKKVEKDFAGFQADAARVSIQPSRPDLKPLVFDVDFIGGQKTGFFLDQRSNIELATKMASGLVAEAKNEQRPLRVLDLFCYVGQWGTQLAHLATSMGVKSEITLVDASAKALELAKSNVERHCGLAKISKSDVLDELKNFENGYYDIVICDPPAFV